MRGSCWRLRPASTERLGARGRRRRAGRDGAQRRRRLLADDETSTERPERRRRTRATRRDGAQQRKADDDADEHRAARTTTTNTGDQTRRRTAGRNRQQRRAHADEGFLRATRCRSRTSAPPTRCRSQPTGYAFVRAVHTLPFAAYGLRVRSRFHLRHSERHSQRHSQRHTQTSACRPFAGYQRHSKRHSKRHKVRHSERHIYIIAINNNKIFSSEGATHTYARTHARDSLRSGYALAALAPHGATSLERSTPVQDSHLRCTKKWPTVEKSCGKFWRFREVFVILRPRSSY